MVLVRQAGAAVRSMRSIVTRLSDSGQSRQGGAPLSTDRGRAPWADAFRWVPALATLALMAQLHTEGPGVRESSDWVSTFHVAGNLVVGDQVDALYPEAGASGLREAAFDRAAHAVLPELPTRAIAIFMYPPPVALLGVPTAGAAPGVSLAMWQVTSLAALALAAWLMARAFRVRPRDALRRWFWFAPVIHVLLIGHVGLVIGVLPLVAGYLWLRRGRDLVGGVALGVLALKPQFLPVAGLLVLALGRATPRAAAGFAATVVALAGLSVVMGGFALLGSWVSGLSLSDRIFTDPSYQFPRSMIISAPAAVLLSLPFDWRETVKPILYGAAAVVSAGAAVSVLRMGRKVGDRVTRVDRALILGLLVAPVVAPHLLFYDLAPLVLLGFLVAPGTLDGRTWRVLSAGLAAYCGLFFLVDADLPIAPVAAGLLVWALVRVWTPVTRPPAPG